jgi:Protein of unknown function DUF262/HNH endonuclease
MIIEMHEITVRELVNGYKDDAEDGIKGFGGRLDIRPPYQREFIYKDKQRAAVIDTVLKGYPLNVMYWCVRSDGNFEIIDGQQRTISICQYINGVFSLNGLYFSNQQNDVQQKILDYTLTIYFCSGTDSERLGWFKTINIAGEQLTEQELRNAVYAGSWVTDAKRHFSKTGCPAYGIAHDYMTGSPIRQDYLETAIEWISDGKIEEYMALHQHDQNVNQMWLYFQNVIAWVKATIPKYRREMKGVQWGTLYNKFKDQKFDTTKIEEEIAQLMLDEDVESKKGIYQYIFTRDERYLNIRAFSPQMKREAYERQSGICPKCNKHYEIEEMEADHIKPWHEGGKTNAANCQMLCRDDNRRKSGN